MKYFHCTAAFGNFNCYSTAEAKDLINIPSSFPLRCFLLTNFTITLLLDSLLYLETGKRWQPSMSFGSISKPKSWQMSITTFSRLFYQINIFELVFINSFILNRQFLLSKINLSKI